MVGKKKRGTLKSQSCLTLADAIKIYKNGHIKRHSLSTKRVYISILSKLEKLFGHILFSDFNEDFIIKACEVLQNKNKTNLLQIKSIFYRLSYIKGRELGERPHIPDTLFNVRCRKRSRVLADNELKDFIEALLTYKPIEFRDAWVTMLLTGLRSGTVRAMHGSNFDLQSRVYHIPSDHMKFRKNNCVCAFGDELWGFLESRIVRAVKENDYLFKYSANPRATHKFLGQETMHFHWQKLTKGRFNDLTIHDLRRTFASQLALKGVPLTTISNLLHHESVATTSIYIQNTACEFKKAVDSNLWGINKPEENTPSRFVAKIEKRVSPFFEKVFQFFKKELAS